jgi:chemotaxis methyl-accepting protein methylase
MAGRWRPRVRGSHQISECKFFDRNRGASVFWQSLSLILFRQANHLAEMAKCNFLAPVHVLLPRNLLFYFKLSASDVHLHA